MISDRLDLSIIFGKGHSDFARPGIYWPARFFIQLNGPIQIAVIVANDFAIEVRTID